MNNHYSLRSGEILTRSLSRSLRGIQNIYLSIYLLSKQPTILLIDLSDTSSSIDVSIFSAGYKYLLFRTTQRIDICRAKRRARCALRLPPWKMRKPMLKINKLKILMETSRLSYQKSLKSSQNQITAKVAHNFVRDIYSIASSSAGDLVHAHFMNEWRPNCKVVKITGKGKYVYVQIPDVLGLQYGCRLLPASEPLPTVQEEQHELNVEEGDPEEEKVQQCDEENDDEGDESEAIESDNIKQKRQRKRRRGPEEGSESLVGAQGMIFRYQHACVCRFEIITSLTDQKRVETVKDWMKNPSTRIRKKKRGRKRSEGERIYVIDPQSLL